jgi:hypothetical protein
MKEGLDEEIKYEVKMTAQFYQEPSAAKQVGEVSAWG